MESVATGLAALRSLKSLYDIAKEIRNSNDPEKLRIAAAQMFDLAMAAREQVAVLQEERNAAIEEAALLKGRIEKVKRFEDQAKGYARYRDPFGASVYREKDPADAQGKSANFCATCFLNEKISILQPTVTANVSINKRDWACPNCQTTISLKV